MCPHTNVYVSSYSFICVLVLSGMQVSWWGYTGTLGAEFVHYVATGRLRAHTLVADGLMRW